MLSSSLPLPLNPAANLAASLNSPSNGATNAAAEPGGFARELSRHTEAQAERATNGKSEAAASEPPSPHRAKASGKSPDAHGKKTERSGGQPSRAARGDAAKADAATKDQPVDVAGQQHAAEAESASTDPTAASDLSMVLAMMQRAEAPATQGETTPAVDGDLVPEHGELPLQAAAAAQARAGGPDLRGADRAAGLQRSEGGKPDVQPSVEPQRGRGSDSFDALMSTVRGTNETHDLHEKAAQDQALIDTAKPAERTGESSAPVVAPVTTGATASTHAAKEVPAATVPAHTHSREFAPALAAQVSVFARDGVQEAKLQLNPAETGPITVRIAIEDAQARVDFVAEHAGTRSAIEASLPDLAASLREAGFTLTGGGVFQQFSGQARDGRQAEPGSHSTSVSVSGGEGDRGDAAATAVSQHRIVPRGNVDLYA